MTKETSQVERLEKYIKQIVRFLPIAIGVVLFLFALIGVKILGIAAPSQESLLAISLLLFSVSYSYFDWLIRESPKAALRDEPLGTAGDLQKCLTAAISGKAEIGKFRVFAMSTGYIHPMMQSFFRTSGTSIGEAYIMVCDAESKNNSVPENFAEHVKSKVIEWRRLKKEGKIRRLDVYTYSFFPTEYYVVIDETDLVMGQFVFDREEPSFVRVVSACHFSSKSGLGATMIKEYVASFDSLITCGVDYGVSPFADTALSTASS